MNKLLLARSTALCALAFASSTMADNCDADIVSSKHVGRSQYEFQIKMSLSECDYPYCAVFVRYEVTYKHPITGHDRTSKHMTTASLKQGATIEKVDKISLAAGTEFDKFDLLAMGVQIQEVSCAAAKVK